MLNIHTCAHTTHLYTHAPHTPTSYTHATHIPTLMYHTRMQHTPQQVNTHISHLYSCIKHMHHTPTHCCAPHTTIQHTYTYHNYTRVPVPHTAGWVHVGRGRSRFQIELSSDPSIIASKGQSQLANLLNNNNNAHAHRIALGVYVPRNLDTWRRVTDICCQHIYILQICFTVQTAQ